MGGGVHLVPAPAAGAVIGRGAHSGLRGRLQLLLPPTSNVRLNTSCCCCCRPGLRHAKAGTAAAVMWGRAPAPTLLVHPLLAAVAHGPLGQQVARGLALLPHLLLHPSCNAPRCVGEGQAGPRLRRSSCASACNQPLPGCPSPPRGRPAPPTAWWLECPATVPASHLCGGVGERLLDLAHHEHAQRAQHVVFVGGLGLGSDLQAPGGGGGEGGGGGKHKRYAGTGWRAGGQAGVHRAHHAAVRGWVGGAPWFGGGGCLPPAYLGERRGGADVGAHAVWVQVGTDPLDGRRHQGVDHVDALRGERRRGSRYQQQQQQQQQQAACCAGGR
jgi:hypothetical protein